MLCYVVLEEEGKGDAEKERKSVWWGRRGWVESAAGVREEEEVDRRRSLVVLPLKEGSGWGRVGVH